MERAVVEKLIRFWEKRNMEGSWCENAAEAASRILATIPPDATVGFSGSQTLQQLGVIEALEKRGNTVYNQYKKGVSREESLALRTSGARADYYLASPNAVAKSGEMVFFSAYSNRTVGVADAQNVIIVAGYNKVVDNLEAALQRAREYVTPRNCKRLNWNTPCYTDGVCRKSACLFPEYKRMCCQILIVEADIEPGRTKVLVVGEELGY